MSLKNIFKKSLATLGAISIVSGNFSLCGVGLSKVIAENLSAPEIKIDITNERYVQYKEEEVTAVVVHSNLNIYPNQEQDTYLPTESVEFSVKLPEVNGLLPEKAIVAEAATKSTTGEELNTKINQNYDSNSGLLTVSYENIPNQEENIYSEYVENAKDEFEIIYSYPAGAYTGNEEEIKLEYVVNSNMSFKTENGSITSQATQEFELSEKDNKGEIASFRITELKENVYKGFLYSNVENKTNYDTEYNTVSTFAVINSGLVNEAQMELKESKFVLNDEEATEISANGNIVYKATKVSKYEFDRILGQDGFIEFYLAEDVYATVKYLDIEDNKKLAVIYTNGNTELLEDDAEIITVNHPEELTSLKIKMSKPVTEGFMHFENQNVIKAAEDYGWKIDEIKSIKTIGKVNELEKITNIELMEPETKVTVNSSNLNFSTLQNNKATLTINLDDTNASAKLFDNPTLELKLPDGLIKGNISSPRVINGNGLKIKETPTLNRKTNVITIKLSGKQTSYDLNNVSGGVSIVMDLENIDFEDTMGAHSDKIEVTCLQGEETVKAACDINIVSKAGLLILSKLSNYDNSGNIVTSIDNTTKKVTVNINEASKEAQYTLDLVNNYDENLKNVQIIRKIGYETEEVKSTFVTNLSKPVQVSDENAKVYYTIDENNWTEDFITQAKAYKVVLNNNELIKGENIQIKEYIQIPQNLLVNQESYLNTNISYNYKESNLEDNITLCMETVKDELQNNINSISEEIEDLNEETIPVNLSIVPITNQDYVHANQTVTYKVQVANNGEADLANLKLKDVIPDNAIYTYEKKVITEVETHMEIIKDSTIKEKIWDIDLLKAGETKEFEIMLTMANVSEEQDIVNKVELEHNNQTISVENKLKIKPALISLDLGTNKDHATNVIYDLNDIVEYNIKVKNTSGEKVKNLRFKYSIPENLAYVEGGIGIYNEFYGYSIDENKKGNLNNGIFEYNINSLEENEEITFVVRCKVNRLESKYTTNVSGIAEVELNGDIYQSNIKTIEISQSNYTVNLESNIKDGTILQVGDTVIYTAKVTNIGDREKLITVKDNIPKEIEVNKMEYGKENEELTEIVTSGQDLEVEENIGVNETFILKITGTVKDQEVDADKTLEFVNVVKVVMDEYEIESNEVKLKAAFKAKEDEEEEDFAGMGNITQDEEDKNDDNINGDNENNGDTNEDGTNNDNVNDDDTNQDNTNNDNTDNEGNTNQGTVVNLYSISGKAWLDSDKNGQKGENENILSNVVVSLVDKQTGNFALDEQGNRIATTTNANGEYKFENLKEGSYLVLYEFDTNNYTVTTYRKSEAQENLNSDAILTNVTIEGVKKLAAITDEIVLTSNKENVDIGLIENPKFDLSLNKLITKVTVINSQGTEVTEYEEGDTAKVDLVAKYMNTANVIVTYKFTVKNEGEITGYVDSLVDDLPSGLEFSSDLNKDWYKGSDGKLYTTSLSKTAIAPGETTTIELVLTKNMTEENTGVFPNNASLDKISNLENIKEKEETLENNQSSATLIISIKTGSVILYTGITILCIGIMAAGAYMIKKKVLNRGI